MTECQMLFSSEYMICNSWNNYNTNFTTTNCKVGRSYKTR